MIRDVGESFANEVLDRAGRLAGRAQERRPLPTDLLENDDAYLVVFDAPDTSAEDVQVRFSDTTIHIRIDRVREHREGFEMRFPGRGLALDGQAELPRDAIVDPDTATATLTNDGTLRVELPKREEPSDEPIRISMDETDEADDTDAVDSRDALEGDDPDAYDASDETDEETTSDGTDSETNDE